MPLIIRPARPEDAALLVQVIDMASDGLVPTLWTEMAPEGTDASAAGHALVTAEEGEFSYRNGFVLERDGAELGGLIGYPLPSTPEPAGPEVPDAFVGVQELANLVPGYWYINMMAVVPDGRRQGLGAALLDAAEMQARDSGCAGVALIVSASNQGALSVYKRAGFTERARRPFDLSDYGAERTDAVLMVKDVSQRR